MSGQSSLFRTNNSKVATGIAALVLVLLMGLSYHDWQRYRLANVEAQRSREILTAIDRVQSALTDAETGQRGFLLTGKNQYLEPYDRAAKELPNDLSDIQKLLGTNVPEFKDFDELNVLAHRKLDELRETVAVRQTQGMQAALAIVLTDEGKLTMDQIRAVCARMKQKESATQQRGSVALEAAAGVALLITVAVSLVLLFLFAFALEPFASPNPEAWQRPGAIRYGAAILAVIVITLIRAALTPLMDPISMPFTLYFCAVVFAAWFGGFRPALLTILLSLLAGSWFFASPTHSLLVSGHDDQVAMLLLVLVGFGFALLSRSQRSAVERALRAEESERNQRQRFETTLGSIGDGVIATDPEGCVTFANPIASALLQWPDAELCGKRVEDVFRIVSEATRSIVENPAVRVLREGQIVGLTNQTILIRRDGSELPVDDSAAPIRDGSGKIQGTVLVFRDVTERRRTEKQLAEQAMLLEQAAAEARSQRERLGLALRAGKMGAFEVYPAQDEYWWSPESYSLFGVNPTDFKPTRSSLASVIHPADRQSFMDYWNENLAEFQPINHEFKILKGDSEERWISCRGTPRYDDRGSPLHYSGLFLDITERREAEQVLRRFEKLSAAARLSAAIAHEINNPLGAVSNLIYLAMTAPAVPTSIVELLAQAEQEVERVAHAARQALGFYRESIKAERIDVSDLIDSVLKIYSTKITEKKIKVLRGCQNCESIYGVRGEIRQVLSNLIVNAIEAVKDGGTISVAAQLSASEEKAVEIIVRDDGHGIGPEHLGHVFEPFFTTKGGTGTGLGLWVAKEIIERHNGTIEVQSTRDSSATSGTTFIVRLPTEQSARLSN